MCCCVGPKGNKAQYCFLDMFFSHILQIGATRLRTPGQPGHISLGQRRPNSHHPHAAELVAATLQVPPLAVRCAVLMMRSSKHGAARSAATTSSSSSNRQMRSNSSQHHSCHSSKGSSIMLWAVLVHQGSSGSSSRSARQRVRTSAAGRPAA